MGFDIVPYPLDKLLPARIALTAVSREKGISFVQFVRGGMEWPYHLTSDEMTSRTSRQTGIVICGRARGLPQQGHDLMLGNSAVELAARKILFFPFERCDVEERLIEDLKLAKELSFIPVYCGRLPDSDSVEITATVPIRFPVIPTGSMDQVRRKIASVKRKLARLLSLPEKDAVHALAEVAEDLDEIDTTISAKESCSFKACVVRFPMLGATESHFALIGQTV